MNSNQIIKVRFENIFVFDDKYVFSQSDNITQSDLKPKADIDGLIILAVMFSISGVFLYFTVKFSLNALPLIVFLSMFIFRIPECYRLSKESVICKKDIIRIYINEKRNCISFKFKEGKKRIKIRSTGLPLEINEKEKVLQTLYANNLISREYISQIIKMKEGFLYIKDKSVSFVDFKLYSKHVDAKRCKNENYLLFITGLFTSLASIVMTVISIILLDKEIWIYILMICVIMLPLQIFYLKKLNKQLIECKSFYIKRDRIAGFSVDDSDGQTLKIQYYSINRKLQQKTLVLSDAAPDSSLFIN
jgi:hypothetical protein